MSKKQNLGLLLTAVISALWIPHLGRPLNGRAVPIGMLSPKTAQPVSAAPGAAPVVRIGFDHPEKRFSNTYVSFNVGPWVKKVGRNPVLPAFLRNAVKARLEQAAKEGKLKSVLVRDFAAADLDVHVTHNFGSYNVSVHRLIFDAVMNALAQAKEKGYYTVSEDGIDLLALPYEEQIKKLQVRANDNTLLERGAESVVVVKMSNVSIGAANIKLFQEFAIPGATPLQKLGLPKAPGFRFIVRRTKDIIEGTPNPDEWEFVISTKAGKSELEKNDSTRLLALASQPNDYQIVAVYPVKGGSLPEDEAVATVVFQPVFAEGKLRSLNPTIIYRSQSGADAVGGIANMVFDVNYVPGGANGGYYVATAPATLEQARRAPKPGVGSVAAYGYQSEHDGRIPAAGVEDLVGQNPPSYEYPRKFAEYLAKIMTSHGEAQPYLSPQEAEERTTGVRHQQDSLFTIAPKDTDVDPFLELIQRRIKEEGWMVVHDRKADMGGILGHTRVPEWMVAVYKATLHEAREKGEISDGNTFGIIDQNQVRDRENRGVGDDGHLLAIGDNDIYGQVTSQLAFKAFTRAYWYATVLGYKPYGLGQDYQGPEAKAAKENPEAYAQFTERFFELLSQYAPKSELKQENVKRAMGKWQEWLRSGKSETQLSEPFSGNVTQQGIGSVSYAFDPKTEQTFDLIAGDKMGPPALNLLIQEGVFSAVDAGVFENGLVVELWDLKAHEEGDVVGDVPSKRIFLDAVRDRQTIKTYLAHSDRYNVRAVWSKSEPGFDIRHPLRALDRVVLSSSVTRLGILTGGEYVGKDDPVIIGNTELMKYLHEFLRTRPLIVQGDMNGSHWEWAVPSSLKNAVATIRSHPIWAGVRYTVSPDGKKFIQVADLYGQSGFNKIRREAYKFNHHFNKAQLGQFEPHGTNVRTVEGSYDLAKIINDLNKPDSPFLRPSPGDVMRDVYRAVPTIGESSVKLEKAL